MKKRYLYFDFWKREIFWVATTGIATMILWIVAYSQLRDLNRTSGEQFLQKLKTDFFTRDARELTMLIEMDALKFKTIKDDSLSPNQNELAIFQIEVPSKFDHYVKSILHDSTKSFYVSNEIDDYLLQHLDDLGKFYRNNLISLNSINDDFGYYITICYENPAIQEYLDLIKQDKRFNDVYRNFEFIYKKLNKK